METANLKPFIRKHLDIIFVGLNPPKQSNNNKHYFSGKNSRFFHLLEKSNLITQKVDKSEADKEVFDSNAINYLNANFGVIDLLPNHVETNSRKVKPTESDIRELVQLIRDNAPRYVCILHSDVRKALEKHLKLNYKMPYGDCGLLLSGCNTKFFLNWFPNGNRITDEEKINVFSQLRDCLKCDLIPGKIE